MEDHLYITHIVLPKRQFFAAKFFQTCSFYKKSKKRGEF